MFFSICKKPVVPTQSGLSTCKRRFISTNNFHLDLYRSTFTVHSHISLHCLDLDVPATFSASTITDISSDKFISFSFASVDRKEIVRVATRMYATAGTFLSKICQTTNCGVQGEEKAVYGIVPSLWFFCRAISG